ncbi:phosphotransferase family protein [Amycolatopsis silviterrae]|uniref:Phosphotransferase family protein n=1 Tax=Amycolatopsis silviterrae TaxID=1656914 RepID=A0ABW5H2U5_9PSEU
MTVTRELAGVVRAAFGARELVSAERLRGGSKKGVYRLTLDDRTTSVAYVWNAGENYWPEAATEDGDPFGHSGGVGLFAAAHAALSEAGVRVPEVILLDDAVALVEDVRGGSLETLMDQDPPRARHVLARLGEAVQTLHSCTRSARTGPLEHLVLRRALDHLAEAAARVEPIAAVERRLAELLGERHAAVAPRGEDRLIHGELGPDHVLVDEHDEPVLIDIEGAMFFDVEWEHVFLELRFGADYRYFRNSELDLDRMRFYRLAQYLSLVAGPLRLLDGDFPHRAGMLDIVDQNIARTLGQLG